MNKKIDHYLNIFHSLNFEKIIDHPNILIAANFWDEERYNAARTCYKYLRAIDDLIDNYKADHTTISGNEKEQFISEVNNWINKIRDKSINDPVLNDLNNTLDKFRIPLFPLEAFARAMIYDINYNGFPTLEKFLKYAEGASVAPASIFVHLCGINKINGQYIPPPYDIKKTALPCACFSYLVHIIRDFQKDQNNNLNYFADDIILGYGLNRNDLTEIARGGNITREFRNLMKEYFKLADYYRQKTYEMIKEINPILEPRYQLSLEIIFNLYLMVFERIDVENGLFNSGELNPTPGEIRERVYKTIMNFKEN